MHRKATSLRRLSLQRDSFLFLRLFLEYPVRIPVRLRYPVWTGVFCCKNVLFNCLAISNDSGFSFRGSCSYRLRLLTAEKNCLASVKQIVGKILEEIQNYIRELKKYESTKNGGENSPPRQLFCVST